MEIFILMFIKQLMLVKHGKPFKIIYLKEELLIPLQKIM